MQSLEERYKYAPGAAMFCDDGESFDASTPSLARSVTPPPLTVPAACNPGYPAYPGPLMGYPPPVPPLPSPAPVFVVLCYRGERALVKHDKNSTYEDILRLARTLFPNLTACNSKIQLKTDVEIGTGFRSKAKFVRVRITPEAWPQVVTPGPSSTEVEICVKGGWKRFLGVRV
ncbi:unnamed protein product [Peniophora sp. CBMAI 1063]|nr:unnamed protein product [Peniophora sp. CBMAI 1063]